VIIGEQKDEQKKGKQEFVASVFASLFC